MYLCLYVYISIYKIFDFLNYITLLKAISKITPIQNIIIIYYSLLCKTRRNIAWILQGNYDTILLST